MVFVDTPAVVHHSVAVGTVAVDTVLMVVADIAVADIVLMAAVGTAVADTVLMAAVGTAVVDTVLMAAVGTPAVVHHNAVADIVPMSAADKVVD